MKRRKKRSRSSSPLASSRAIRPLQISLAEGMRVRIRNTSADFPSATGFVVSFDETIVRVRISAKGSFPVAKIRRYDISIVADWAWEGNALEQERARIREDNARQCVTIGAFDLVDISIGDGKLA